MLEWDTKPDNIQGGCQSVRIGCCALQKVVGCQGESMENMHVKFNDLT